MQHSFVKLSYNRNKSYSRTKFRVCVHPSIHQILDLCRKEFGGDSVGIMRRLSDLNMGEKEHVYIYSKYWEGFRGGNMLSCLRNAGFTYINIVNLTLLPAICWIGRIMNQRKNLGT